MLHLFLRNAVNYHPVSLTCITCKLFEYILTQLKQTASFSLIHSFMEYGITLWDLYQKYNSDTIEKVQCCKGLSKVGIQDVLDELGLPSLSQRSREAQ